MTVDRRTLLQALAAVSASLIAARATPALAKGGDGLTDAQFGQLSAALAGYPATDADTLRKMMAQFATPARRASLATLAKLVASTPAAQLDVELRARGLDTLANELVAAWYSGIVATAKGPSLVLYTGALVWSAMSYSKPMGVCGGVTGYWADPPS